MYALSSLPPKPSTTARGRSSLTRALICSNQLKTSGRVSPVAMRPSTPPDRLDHRARAGGAHDRIAGRDHERVARDPEPQLLLRARTRPSWALAAARLLRGRGGRPLRAGRDRARRPRLGQRDLGVDLVGVGAADQRLHALARAVEQERVADVGERAGERERDVALPPGRLVVGRLVDPRRVEQQPDREREHADDERVAGAPLAPARRVSSSPGATGPARRGSERRGARG